MPLAVERVARSIPHALSGVELFKSSTSGLRLARHIEVGTQLSRTTQLRHGSLDGRIGIGPRLDGRCQGGAVNLSLLLVMSGELTGVGETVPPARTAVFRVVLLPSIHEFHMFAQSPSAHLAHVKLFNDSQASRSPPRLAT